MIKEIKAGEGKTLHRVKRNFFRKLWDRVLLVRYLFKVWFVLRRHRKSLRKLKSEVFNDLILYGIHPIDKET